ncbi:MAG: HAMP domain-containing protein [Pseudobutyrivibrio ruminis]|nr:HAMP domain-containing protein [Pseudobutyrivibrio ruminis]
MAKESTEKRAKVRKIKDKLLALIIPAVIVMIIVLVTISTLLSRDRMQEMAQSNLESSIGNQSDNISSWLNENLENFAAIKRGIEGMNLDDEALVQYLTSYVGTNTNSPNSVYVASMDGSVLYGQGAEISVTNPTEEQWFKEGMSRVNMAYGSPYKNEEGQYVISASGIIVEDSDVIRVAAADVTLDQISIIVNSGVKMKNASSFLVDADDMMILAHRDDALVSTTISDSSSDPIIKGAYKKISASDYSTEVIDGYTVAFSEVAGTNWVLVSYIANSIIMADITKLSLILIGVGAIAVILISIMISVIIGRVVRPIASITQNISAMSDGDFTIEVAKESNDEIGVMGEQVGRFVVLMRKMLASISNESDKLKQESDNSDRVSKDMFDASQSQENAMVNLKNTVDELALAVNEIAENATTLAMVVSDTRENSNQANESMKETVEISKQGRSDMEQLSLAMAGIKNSNDALVESINEVGKASEEITKIVGLIAEIADETNLLSLNASIEAARAGEAGKGFAVVATEIGKLAQTSADSADNIASLINDVGKAIDSVVAQAENSARNIEANSELINTAVETFDRIYQNIEKSNELLDLMIQDVQKVDEVSTNVAAISEEQAASADEILETSKHMVEQAQSITASSQDVADNSHELANTSQTLTGYVQQFKIVKEEVDE